jgi:hypothetical protein
MQPGDTITPNNTPASEKPAAQEVVVNLSAPVPTPAPAPVETPTELPQPQPSIEATPAPPSPAEQPKEPQPDNEVPSPWQFNDNASAKISPQVQSTDTVSWSASEFVAHHKEMSWFAGLGFLIAIVAIAVYLVSRDFVAPIMIALLGVFFGYFASRSPQVLEYMVNDRGISIGQKFYGYDSFKAFSVTEDGAIHSIVLAPLQRFMPPITVYYEPSDEDRIVDILANYLPFEEAKHDAVDSLMRRVRF